MDTIDQPLIRLLRAAGDVQRQLASSLSAHGIGFTEYLVLLHLQHAPNHGLRRIDLAGKVGLTASGVTRLLNPMEKIGLVRKEHSARDARASLVALTATGERVLTESSVWLDAVADRILSRFDANDRAALEAVIARLG